MTDRMFINVTVHANTRHVVVTYPAVSEGVF